MKPSSIRRLLLIFALVPIGAYANAGTGLLFPMFFHLYLANAFIGVLEGGLIAAIYRVAAIRTILVMIAANYFSAWVGLMFIGFSRPTLDINNALLVFVIAMIVFFALTLVLEFPFVAFTLRKKDGWRKKSIVGSLVAQTISYLLLVGMYTPISSAFLYTENQIVAPNAMSVPENVSVYYIGDVDGDVYRLTLHTHRIEKFAELNSKADDRLFAIPSEQGETWDLMVLHYGSLGDDSTVVKAGITGIARSTVREGLSEQPIEPRTWVNSGPVPKLGSAVSSRWNIESGFGIASGLRAENISTGEKAHVAWEMPFFETWLVRNAMHLPTDKVLFQLGNDQICLFDPARHEVALLAKGRGPIAVIEE